MIKTRILEIAQNFNKLAENCESEIEEALKLILISLKAGGKIMFCGNGGSAADSQHLSAELIGRYKKNRKPIAGLALTTDTSSITAISNDFSFDDIFTRQIEALGKEGDILYAISTSGESKNILNAIHFARKMKIRVIGLTGNKKSKINEICDVIINVPAETPDRIQEMHIAVGQIICEVVENEVG